MSSRANIFETDYFLLQRECWRNDPSMILPKFFLLLIMLRFVKGLFQPITLVLIFLLPLKNSKAATFAASVDQAPLLWSKR